MPAASQRLRKAVVTVKSVVTGYESSGTGAFIMKLRWILPILMAAAISLTGCGIKQDMTVQQDEMPVSPAETTFVLKTDTPSANTANTTAVTATQTTASVQTDAGKSSTAPNRTAETTAEGSRDGSGSGNSGGKTTSNSLYGKWETVSFSKDSGGSVPYDLSDPVHKSYYVGLDLNEAGQSALTVGTEGHPATVSFSGNTIEVCTVNRNNPVRMVFTVSADKNSMTAELMNGKIIATLKRVQNDFSIKNFLTADTPAESKYSAADLVGEWSFPGTFGNRNNSMTVRADGSVIMRYAAGATRRGKVRIDKDTHPDGSVSYWYSLCDDDNTAWLGFACGNTPVNRLYSDQDGGIEFVRITLEDIAVEKMNNLTFLMRSMAGGGGDLKIDRSQTVTAAGQTYARLTDSRFGISSLGKAAFERLLEETLSGPEKEQWRDVLNENIIEQDGQPYILISNAHGYYSFETGSGVTITQQTENSFTAVTKDRNMMDGDGTANFVFDGTNWTIESNLPQ